MKFNSFDFRKGFLYGRNFRFVRKFFNDPLVCNSSRFAIQQNTSIESNSSQYIFRDATISRQKMTSGGNVPYSLTWRTLLPHQQKWMYNAQKTDRRMKCSSCQIMKLVSPLTRFKKLLMRIAAERGAYLFNCPTSVLQYDQWVVNNRLSDGPSHN